MQRDPHDFRSYTDQELDDFLKNLPFHVAYRAAVFEHERRQNKKRDQTSEDRHTETVALGKQTLSVGKQGLNWAKIAGIAGIAAVLIGAASLIVQIYFSKPAPSTPATTSPTPSPQMPATISESPESAATAGSATPTPTPIMFPPPAPYCYSKVVS